jgi:undecaprenyl-diphosphatase
MSDAGEHHQHGHRNRDPFHARSFPSNFAAITKEKPATSTEVPSNWNHGGPYASIDGLGKRQISTMALFTVRPTAADIAIANAIAAHTNPPAEELAEALTCGADEHLLLGVTAAWWLYSRAQSRHHRKAADHFLLATLVASGLPHVLKTVFNQQRPDRLTARGHRRGIPLSGKPLDAFPSGHAVHVDALASAASELPERQRNLMWLPGAGLVATWVILLAHWTSDVIAGLAIGALTERWLRRFTGYGRANRDGRPPCRTTL